MVGKKNSQRRLQRRSASFFARQTKGKKFPPFGLAIEKTASFFARQTKGKKIPPLLGWRLQRRSASFFARQTKGKKIPPFWAGDCKKTLSVFFARQTKGKKIPPFLGWRLQGRSASFFARQTKGKKIPPFWAGDCKDAQRLFRQPALTLSVHQANIVFRQGVNEGAYSPVTCLPAGDRPLATVMRYPYSCILRHCLGKPCHCS